MTFRSHLIHTCTIQANTATQAGSGAEAENWADETTGEPCRLIDGRSFRPMENVGQQVQFDKRLLLLPTATATTEHRITNVRDADGGVVDAGPLRIVESAARRRRGPGAHHLALKLERVS